MLCLFSLYTKDMLKYKNHVIKRTFVYTGTATRVKVLK